MEKNDLNEKETEPMHGEKCCGIRLFEYLPAADGGDGTDAGKACCLIKRFWLEHNGETQTDAEARADLCAWTAEGHRFFFILPKDGAELSPVGFAHLGSRGAAADWLEDLFILPEFQGRGIGSEAIKLLESTVKQYSESMYIEAAARNERAIRLYRRLGYDCLNTITIRKDFEPEKFETLHKETLLGETFGVRRYKR